MMFHGIAEVGMEVVLAAVLVGLLALAISEYVEYEMAEIHEIEFKSGKLSAMEFTAYIRQILAVLQDSKRLKAQSKISQPLLSYMLQHNRYCRLADC